MLIQNSRDARLVSGKLFEEEPFGLHVNEFTEGSAKDFREAVSKALRIGMPIVPVTVDSAGGSAYALLSMAETIRACPVPVATTVVGRAMSAGAYLLSLGTPGYRTASPHAGIMIHRVSAFTSGTVPAMKGDVAHSEALDDRLIDMIAATTHRDGDYFRRKLRDLEGADWYLTPHEAFDIGLIDRVGVPTLEVDVGVRMELKFDGE